MDYKDCGLQNGRSLEDYVEVYLNLFQDANWDEESLKQQFWSRMDDLLTQMLLLGDLHLSFVEFIDHTLWVCGSSLIAGLVESQESHPADIVPTSCPP